MTAWDYWKDRFYGFLATTIVYLAIILSLGVSIGLVAKIAWWLFKI